MKVKSLRMGLDCPPDMLANIKFHSMAAMQTVQPNYSHLVDDEEDDEEDEDGMMMDANQQFDDLAEDGDFNMIHVDGSSSPIDPLNEGQIVSPSMQYDDDDDDELSNDILEISRIVPPILNTTTTSTTRQWL